MPSLIRQETNRTASPFSFDDLEQRAAGIIASAQLRARQIIQEAQQQVDTLRAMVHNDAFETGRAEGYAAGHKAGFEEAFAQARHEALTAAREETDHCAAALTDGARQFARSKRKLLAEAEYGLVRLAVALAQRVCKIAWKSGEAPLAANAQALLAIAAGCGDLELHLSKPDVEVIEEAQPELLAALRNTPHVSLHVQDDAPRGTCRIVTAAASLDASLDIQLERLAQDICGELSA
jgi:flagellar assembly protein FliH